MASGSWDDDEIEKLRELWDAHYSASVIASHLQLRSRNSVLGMVHRLGLPSRASPIVRAPRVHVANPTKEQAARERRNKWQREFMAKKRAEARGEKPERVPAVKVEAKEKRKPAQVIRKPVNQERVGKMTLEECQNARGCLWPSGDRPFTFCGAEKDPLAPYCEDHSRIASTPCQPRKEIRPW